MNRLVLILLFYSGFALGQNTFLRHNQFNPIGGRFYGNNSIQELANKEIMVIGMEGSSFTGPRIYTARYKKDGTLISVESVPVGFSISALEEIFIQENGSFILSGTEVRGASFLPYTLFFDSSNSLVEEFRDTIYLSNIQKLGEDRITAVLNEIKSNGDTLITSCIFDSNFEITKKVHFEGRIVNKEDALYLFNNSMNDSTYVFELKDTALFKVGSFIEMESGTFEFLKESSLIAWSNDYDSLFSPHFFVYSFDEKFNINWKYSINTSFSVLHGVFPTDYSYPLNIFFSYYEEVGNYFNQVYGKLDINGVLDTVLQYKIQGQPFVFRPYVQTEVSGYVGLAYHWNQPYQFNIMKTDSLGQVFNSDYLGGITFIIDTTTGVADSKSNHFVSLFPNPASTHFTIQSNTAAAVAYTLYTPNGKEVSGGQFVGQAEVSVADIAKGVYFIQLQHEAGIEVRKVVVR